MWVSVGQGSVQLDLSKIKRVGATLESEDIRSPVIEVRISFDWQNDYVKLSGQAAQDLWDLVLKWNQDYPNSPIPVAWHSRPRSASID